MDRINETIVMLQGLKDAAEPIQTPDSGCGYSTLIKDVKCDDSFTWVIEEAISLLNEFQKVKTQQKVVIKNKDKYEIDRLKEILSNQQGLCVASDVEIEPVMQKVTTLGDNDGAVNVFLYHDAREGLSLEFVDNSTPYKSSWKMMLPENKAKALVKNLIFCLGGA